MTRHRNHVIYSTDQSELRRLQEEYTIIGRDTKLEEGQLIVLALPRNSRTRKQKKQDSRKARRDKK